MSDDGVLDPTTGELIERDNIDSLLAAYDRIDKADKELYAAKNQIRAIIGEAAKGLTKTRRVRGKEWQCVVEMPDTTFNNAIVKELWNSYPGLRDDFLKIDTISVRRREYKKLLETTGTPDLEYFRDTLKKAEKPATSLPRIVIEKSPQGEVIVPEPNQSELF